MRALLGLLLLSFAELASSRRKPKLRAGHARLPADPASGWPAADPELLGAAAALGLLEPRRCDFASVDGAALTPEAFESDHLRKAPIVVTGLTESWPARRGGWEREALLGKHGELEITHAQASDVAQFGPKEGGGKSITSALREWVASTMDSTDGVHSPLAFDRSATNIAYKLHQQGDFNLPAALTPGGMSQLLLSLGPPRAGLPLHTHGDSWLALTHGTKLWMVFPPSWGAKSHKAAYELLALRPAADILTAGLLSALPEEERPMMCVQQAGDLVYLPALWWHATVNLNGAVGVGAQNDVDDYTPATDEALEDLIMDFPASGRALYQAAAHFLNPRQPPEAASEGLRFGWGLFSDALVAEPDNCNYRAALARIGGALEAKGYALPEGMPRPAAALLDAASRVDAAVKAGSLSGFEAQVHKQTPPHLAFQGHLSDRLLVPSASRASATWSSRRSAW